MPFEDFHKKASKPDFISWIPFCLAILLVVGTFLMPFILTEFPQIAPVKRPSLVSRRILSVDEFCKSLPKPEQFSFVSRRVSELGETTTAVTYVYQTYRDLDEIMPSFRVWFTSNGWENTRQSNFTFKNGKQTITIKRPGETEPDEKKYYEIVCEEISYEIYD
jgi:hypothetical protein